MPIAHPWSQANLVQTLFCSIVISPTPQKCTLRNELEFFWNQWFKHCLFDFVTLVQDTHKHSIFGSLPSHGHFGLFNLLSIFTTKLTGTPSTHLARDYPKDTFGANILFGTPSGTKRKNSLYIFAFFSSFCVVTPCCFAHGSGNTCSYFL